MNASVDSVAKAPADPSASRPSPAVTVVIPLYNKVEVVGRALGSVSRQTLRDFEVVVVDDGSTDGGADVIRKLGDPRVRLIVQQNVGVSAARNTGILAARATLVAFLDADDEWMPDHLETLVRLRDQFGQCEVVATGYVIRVATGDDRSAVLRGCTLTDGEGVLEDYFTVASRSDPPLWSSAVAATKSAILSVGGFPEGIAQGEDLLTWARLAAKFSIAYATRASAVFWQPEFREVKPTRTPEKPDRVGSALKSLLDEARPDMRTPLRAYIGLWHRMRGNMFLRLSRRAEARQEFVRAVKLGGPGLKLFVYLALASLPGGLARFAMGLWTGANKFHRRAS
jgi:hypothetical protein